MAINHPFENETESAQVRYLTLENRVDRVSISGHLNITQDQKGLADLLKLTTTLNRMLDRLQQLKMRSSLPENITTIKPTKVNTPFQHKSF